MQLLVVLNPAAGRRKRALLDLTLAYLKVRGWSVDLYQTRAAGDAQDYVQSYSGSASIVIAAGGDGTVNEVINGLSARQVPLTLAIIPLGTTNVVARELRLPQSAKALASRIHEGSTRLCYWPTVNGRRLAFSLGVGFDAAVVGAVDLAIKKRFGKLAYGWAAIKPLFRWRGRGYRVVADGVEYDADSLLVSNGCYYAGRYVIAREMTLQRNAFQVVLIKASSPGSLLAALWSLPFGRLEKNPRVRSVTASHLSVERLNPEERLQLDGDVWGALPVTVSCAAQGMPVICGP
ncbi:diacylglycerol/lipid kinase family protein [Aestuariirhabdus sp. LZHN29]|uniref:diacylglycerol/lipid kinase family protein n=1 Tax=Aestuariirhabdus sp. LZHN29 TaxID=3417462 RepID=UPI003CE9EFCE